MGLKINMQVMFNSLEREQEFRIASQACKVCTGISLGKTEHEKQNLQNRNGLPNPYRVLPLQFKSVQSYPSTVPCNVQTGRELRGSEQTGIADMLVHIKMELGRSCNA